MPKIFLWALPKCFEEKKNDLYKKGDKLEALMVIIILLQSHFCM